MAWVGGLVFRDRVSRCSGGVSRWGGSPGGRVLLGDVVEVFAQGVVAGEDGGVRVGGDPVNDGVGEDLFFHAVVPLAGWELGAVDR